VEGYLMEDYRLDVYLKTKNLTESRETAKQLILNGCVYVNEILITKPSLKVSDDDKINVIQNIAYVGRGASKIEKAIKYFNIDTVDKTAVDIGASTGGFTDYLLKNNAKKVYAIDVGHNQLHESLKTDKRVINLEGTNFRYIDVSIFSENIDIITVDVSFISLKLILPRVFEISHKDTDIILLIKPQFEAGRHNIGKNGIIKDKKIHLEVLNNIVTYCNENGLFFKDVTYSPIKGGEGNIEYLGYIKKGLNNNSLNYEHKFKDLILKAFELK
jgi:23S rRNA (cytidine1920-2'-O)/16S rRNA (cytidine1409-2'-O)-methyltransferase